jgi:hypothetical protein
MIYKSIICTKICQPYYDFSDTKKKNIERMKVSIDKTADGS